MPAGDRKADRDQLELRAAQAEHERRESLHRALVLGGSVGSLVAAVLSGGSLWPILATAGAEGLSIASTGIPETQTIEFRGATAEGLLDELVDALRAVEDRVDPEFENLGEEVRRALARVEHLRGGPDGDDGRLIPVRPDIVDGVDAESFYIP